MKKFIGIVLIAVTLVACQQDFEPGGTVVQDLSGDWYVEFAGPIGTGIARLSSYNTAADNNQMWIDDHQESWWFKVRVDVNTDAMTFAGQDSSTKYLPIDTVIIANGRVMPGAATTPSGGTSDSIYFEAYFSDLGPGWDDETAVSTFSGFKRTGFPEDEP